MASTSAPLTERRLHGNLGVIAIVFMVVGGAAHTIPVSTIGADRA